MTYSLLTDKIVRGAYRYVEHFAKYRGITQDTNPDLLDDLLGAADDALMYACESYDSTKGATFATWARVMVRNHLYTALGRSNAGLLQVPKYTLRRWLDARRALEGLTRELMREPTMREWADAAGITIGELHSLRDRCHQHRYVMDPSDTDAYDIEDETDYQREVDILRDSERATEWLIKAKDALGDTTVKAFVYAMFNEDGLTQSDIAEMFGMSQSGVHRAVRDVLEFIRINLNEETK